MPSSKRVIPVGEAAVLLLLTATPELLYGCNIQECRFVLSFGFVWGGGGVGVWMVGCVLMEGG